MSKKIIKTQKVTPKSITIDQIREYSEIVNKFYSDLEAKLDRQLSKYLRTDAARWNAMLQDYRNRLLL